MASNELEVKIGADIDSLLRELNKAKRGMTGFENRVGKMTDKLKSSGKRFRAIGISMSKAITLPLLAAGAASVKMAADFDESMTKIKTLVGIAGSEVDQMAISVKQLAKDTGISSKEAAEALFFITSAGIKGAKAMEVLESALKASAAGLGETKTIADLATSAMNAYGSEVLSASNATDIMLAAVREGKLAPEELAESMGRVLPLASALGVEFNDVAAAFAAMSRTGTNAAEASTQISGIFSALVKPSNDAEKALSEMGLSSKELREQLKEKGLISTLNTLKEAFKGNEDTAARVFGNIRALRGVLDLTGANVDTTREIFEKMNNTMGDTEKAFEKVQKSASFKLKKSINDVKEVFTDLGSVLLPIIIPAIQKLSNFVKDLASKFNSLNTSTKNMVLAMTGIVAVLPLVITLLGGVLTALGALLSPIGLVVTAVVALGVAVYKNFDSIVDSVASVYNSFVDLYNQSILVRGIIASIGTAFKIVWTSAERYLSNIWAFMKAVGNNILNLWGGIGKVLAGALTFDIDKIKEGLQQAKTAFVDGFSEVQKEVEENNKVAGEKIATALTDGINETISGELEKTTPEKLKEGLSNMAESVSGYATQVGAQIASALGLGFSGGGEGGGESGGESSGEETGGGNMGLSGLVATETDTTIQVLKNFSEQAKDIINNGILDTFSNMAESIGAAFGSGRNAVKAGGSAILSSLGGVLVQFGKLVLATGLAADAFKSAITNPFGGGIGAIVAGAALIAAGGAMRAFASKQSSGSSSGSSGSNFQGSTGVATSSAPRSSTNISRGSSSSNSLQNVVFNIEGTKLVGVLSNTLARNKQLAGTLTVG